MWRKLLFWKRTDLDEELDFYREMREAELRAAGLSPEEAGREARRRLGNVTQLKEEARAAWTVRWLDELRQDLGYALRSLRATPGFAVMAIGALGLGIGFNTSLFTLFNAVALRPPEIQDPAHVVSILQVDARRSRVAYRGLQHPFFEYLRDQAKSMSGIAAHRTLGSLLMERQGQRVNVQATATSGNYFAVLGVPMAWGRNYTAEDDRAGLAEPPVVLSYRFWQSQFAGRRDVLGGRLTLNRVPLRIIGVANEEFQGISPDAMGVWVPFHALALLQPENSMVNEPGACCTDVLGRLKAGVTRSEAQSEIAVLGDRWRKEHQRESHGMLLTGASFFSHPRIQERLGPVLALLGLAVALVLLLVCVNVSNLLLARASARRKEIAVRLSLGAGRGRLIRQLLTESLVLSLAGAAIGLALATMLPKVILNAVSDQTLTFRLEPDGTVLVFSLIVSLLATVVFGLMPALQATRFDVQSALKGANAKLRRWDTRRLLAAAQVALCVILLTSAGLLLRGVLHANRADAGFDTRGLAVLRLDLRLFGYDEARALTLTRTLRERLLALPGVTGVSYSDILPFGNNSNGTDFIASNGGRTLERAVVAQVDPGHLEMLGVPLVAGRHFTPRDAGQRVAIISEATARLAWGGEDPLGRKFRAVQKNYEVVGVARNSVYRGLESKAEPTYFLPSAGGLDATFLVRLKEPRQLGLLREAVRSLDPQVLPVVNRLDQDMAETLKASRVAASIALGLGTFALTLACVGLYGVVAYNVAQRTREIGVRMALGAQPREVTRLVLWQNLRAVFAGMIVGLLGAGLLSGLLTNLLYGLSPLDPVAYAGVVGGLGLATFAASVLPARRAAAVDPLAALRAE
ncbi:MAG: ABC transporter permease [Bryobacteraceae bacterium]|nr:ABC transporter permease [Bryobacteraceae bacterium]